MNLLGDRLFRWNPVYFIFNIFLISYYGIYSNSHPYSWGWHLFEYLPFLNSTSFNDLQLPKNYGDLFSIPVKLSYEFVNMDSPRGWILLWIPVCILTIVFVFYYYHHHFESLPGPWGLPIFGYLPLLSRTPYKDFKKLSEKYGNIFSIRMGIRYVVVINDYETIKETAMKEIFTGKPTDGRAAEFGDYKNTFVTDGTLWRDQRRFLLNSLREFGFGKQQMENNICDEAKQIIEEFYKTEGQPVEVRDTIYYAVTNIISYLIFGQKFQYDEKDILRYVKLAGEANSQESHFSICDAFPKLEYLLLLPLFGLKTFDKTKNELYRFIDLKIEEHKKSFDSNNIRDVIDVYLLKQENIRDNKLGLKLNIFSDDYIRANILLLFVAGTETTSATVSWGLKLLALNPKIQTRVQEEIDCVIGSERIPKMSDKHKMPFTEATILEIERFISHVPLSFYHRITEDTTVKGYKIPKDTFVLYNLWNVHNDPNIWKNPSEFNPGRFLDGDGKISKLRDYVIPFSLGKRNCLGESLAKMEIFLFLTSFLQKLTFQIREDTTFDTSTEVPTRNLKSCCLIVIPRN